MSETKDIRASPEIELVERQMAQIASLSAQALSSFHANFIGGLTSAITLQAKELALFHRLEAHIVGNTLNEATLVSIIRELNQLRKTANEKGSNENV